MYRRGEVSNGAGAHSPFLHHIGYFVLERGHGLRVDLVTHFLDLLHGQLLALPEHVQPRKPEVLLAERARHRVHQLLEDVGDLILVVLPGEGVHAVEELLFAHHPVVVLVEHVEDGVRLPHVLLAHHVLAPHLQPFPGQRVAQPRGPFSDCRKALLQVRLAGLGICLGQHGLEGDPIWGVHGPQQRHNKCLSLLVLKILHVVLVPVQLLSPVLPHIRHGHSSFVLEVYVIEVFP
mmetsp:Transcript_9803/g.20416  ORF Transcript_9803/g.20416 Transcript_9803/m.20416 type:complete len:234 (+) Transcript_9803:316-1017(+)